MASAGRASLKTSCRPWPVRFARYIAVCERGGPLASGPVRGDQRVPGGAGGDDRGQVPQDRGGDLGLGGG